MGKSGDIAGILETLYGLVQARHGASTESSYTSRLLQMGAPAIAKKLGEEAVETVIEAVRDDKDSLVAESTDLLYHLVVLWHACGVTPAQIEAEIQKRKGKSGLQEKAERTDSKKYL